MLDECRNANDYPYFSDTTTEIERLLFVASHECEHYFQHFDCKNGILNLKSYYMVIREITGNSKNDEYSKNYNYKQIENQANINGWGFVGTFLAQYGYGNGEKKGRFRAWLQASARDSISFQKKDKSMIIEDYNISTLIDECYKHPSYIDKYPILKRFFESEKTSKRKGCLKDVSVLIDDYNKLPRNMQASHEEQQIYREFFYYLFNKKPELIDKKSGNLVLDLIVEDLYSLQSIFDYKKDSKGKNRVIEIKVGRIIKFYNFIEKLGLTQSIIEPRGTIEEKIKNTLKELLKVYETSKKMYNNKDENIETLMNGLRSEFDMPEIQFRNPEGRDSAINI